MTRHVAGSRPLPPTSPRHRLRACYAVVARGVPSDMNARVRSYSLLEPEDTMASPQPAPDTSLDFTHSDPLVAELLDHLRATADLRALGALASWDQNTALPDGAGEIRGHQLATLQGVLHDRWTAERLGTLLSELAERVTRPSYSDADRGLLREARRAYDHAAKLPRGLV